MNNIFFKGGIYGMIICIPFLIISFLLFLSGFIGDTERFLFFYSPIIFIISKIHNFIDIPGFLSMILIIIYIIAPFFIIGGIIRVIIEKIKIIKSSKGNLNPVQPF